MLRRYTHGGSALDLREAAGSQMSVTSAPVPATHEGFLRPGPSTFGSHSPGKLRRVLTAHVRRNSQKKQNKNFSLKAMLKEPLRLVNSVPLNFDYSRYDWFDVVYTRHRRTQDNPAWTGENGLLEIALKPLVEHFPNISFDSLGTVGRRSVSWG